MRCDLPLDFFEDRQGLQKRALTQAVQNVFQFRSGELEGEFVHKVALIALISIARRITSPGRTRPPP